MEVVLIIKHCLPSCPSCGNKLGKLETFVIKNRSVYKCPNCGKIAEVFLLPAIYRMLWITQILAVVVFVSAVFLGGSFPLIGLFIVLCIFGMFYWFSTRFIVLDQPRYEKVKPPWYKRKLSKSNMKNVSEKKTRDYLQAQNNNLNKDHEFKEDKTEGKDIFSS